MPGSGTLYINPELVTRVEDPKRGGNETARAGLSLLLNHVLHGGRG